LIVAYSGIKEGLPNTTDYMVMDKKIYFPMYYVKNILRFLQPSQAKHSSLREARWKAV
jgi:hypothetical protein